MKMAATSEKTDFIHLVLFCYQTLTGHFCNHRESTFRWFYGFKSARSRFIRRGVIDLFRSCLIYALERTYFTHKRIGDHTKKNYIDAFVWFTSYLTDIIMWPWCKYNDKKCLNLTKIDGENGRQKNGRFIIVSRKIVKKKGKSM